MVGSHIPVAVGAGSRMGRKVDMAAASNDFVYSCLKPWAVAP